MFSWFFAVAWVVIPLFVVGMWLFAEHRHEWWQWRLRQWRARWNAAPGDARNRSPVVGSATSSSTVRHDRAPVSLPPPLRAQRHRRQARSRWVGDDETGPALRRASTASTATTSAKNSRFTAAAERSDTSQDSTTYVSHLGLNPLDGSPWPDRSTATSATASSPARLSANKSTSTDIATRHPRPVRRVWTPFSVLESEQESV